MASVIKLSSVDSQSEPSIYRFEDIAQRRIDEAEAQAAAILADARQKAEQLFAAAEASGYEAATRRADDELNRRLSDKIDTLLPALRDAVGQLNDTRQAWMRHWEMTAVQLAIRISQRVIRRELDKTSDVPLVFVREALQMAVGAPRIKIGLNSQDFQALGDQVGRLCAEVGTTADCDIVADASVSRGGCKLTTQHGTIDQQIEAQLARIAAELTTDH